jgi:beta-lactamase regulating signal transducer with metallopeptidase domain
MEDNNLSNQAPNQGQNVNQQFNNQFGQLPVPNSAAVLVLGILSIVFCFCYGFIGLVMGIIAIVLAGKANELYKANPSNYTAASFNNLKAGKICAIIGTILSALMLVYVIVVFFIVGAAMTGLPWSQMMKGH